MIALWDFDANLAVIVISSWSLIFTSLKKDAVSPSIIGCSKGLLRLLEGDPCDEC